MIKTMSTSEMDETQMSSPEAEEEMIKLRRKDSRRQRQQLRFAQEEEEEKKEDESQRLPTNFKPPGRASRFLSIVDSSLQLPGASLLRLQQLHNQTMNNQDSLGFGEISDELLDKIPFKIEIIPDRRDDFDMSGSTIAKARQKSKEPIEIPAVISSGLSSERRLEIIEEILQHLSQVNVLDEIRRTHAIPFQLPRNTQMQKNVANRMRDLTGSDTIMLNDHLYMKNICKRLAEKHQEELEANFERLASNEKRRRLFESING